MDHSTPSYWGISRGVHIQSSNMENLHICNSLIVNFQKSQKTQINFSKDRNSKIEKSSLIILKVPMVEIKGKFLISQNRDNSGAIKIQEVGTLRRVHY